MGLAYIGDFNPGLCRWRGVYGELAFSWFRGFGGLGLGRGLLFLRSIGGRLAGWMEFCWFGVYFGEGRRSEVCLI